MPFFVTFLDKEGKSNAGSEGKLYVELKTLTGAIKRARGSCYYRYHNHYKYTSFVVYSCNSRYEERSFHVVHRENIDQQ